MGYFLLNTDGSPMENHRLFIKKDEDVFFAVAEKEYKEHNEKYTAFTEDHLEKYLPATRLIQKGDKLYPMTGNVYIKLVDVNEQTVEK